MTELPKPARHVIDIRKYRPARCARCGEIRAADELLFTICNTSPPRCRDLIACERRRVNKQALKDAARTGDPAP